jgi:hypothetical protein
MELTRRDALAALSGAGIVVGGTAAALRRDPISFEDGSMSLPTGEEVTETLVAVADLVYPSAISNVREFVVSYAGTRMAERAAYRSGVREAVADLDSYTAVHFDAERFAGLDGNDRSVLLDQLGVRTADPEPEGTITQRVRYYLVNELLYALYASPTGGELVGIENPQGHPGGATSYRQGPPE